MSLAQIAQPSPKKAFDIGAVSLEVQKMEEGAGLYRRIQLQVVSDGIDLDPVVAALAALNVRETEGSMRSTYGKTLWMERVNGQDIDGALSHVCRTIQGCIGAASVTPRLAR